jgi:hypothetical protein
MPKVTAVVTVSGNGGSQQITASCLVGAAGLMGATVDPGGYGLTSYAAAAQLYNTYTGTACATSVQKWYLQEGKGITAGAIPKGITDLAKLGCQFLLCVKPDRAGVVPGGTPNATGQQQITLMQQTVAALQDAGVRITAVIPWQEANLRDNAGTPWFPTPQAYWDYVTCYSAPFLDAGWALAYDPGLDTERYAEAFAFLPAGGGPFRLLLCDYYGDSSGYRGGIRLDAAWNGIGPAGGFVSIADELGLPFGLGEWGAAAAPTTPPQANWAAYSAHVLAVLTGRLAAGLVNGPAVWYSGTNKTGPNIVTSAADYKVAGISAVWQQTSLQVLGV